MACGQLGSSQSCCLGLSGHGERARRERGRVLESLPTRTQPAHHSPRCTWLSVCTLRVGLLAWAHGIGVYPGFCQSGVLSFGSCRHCSCAQSLASCLVLRTRTGTTCRKTNREKQMQMTCKRGRKETQVFPSTGNSAHWSFPRTLLTLGLERWRLFSWWEPGTTVYCVGRFATPQRGICSSEFTSQKGS